MKRVFCTFFMFCVVKCSIEGNCTIRNSFGKDIWFCCDNHEMINDTCVECPGGFESVDGNICEPCKTGNYGRKCGQLCRCLEHQTCDHITGCTNIPQHSTEAEFTGPVTKTLADGNGIWRTSHLFSTFKSFTFKTKDPTDRTRTSTITSTKSKENDLGFNNREIIVYTVCASIFAFFILLCNVCQRRYKQIYGNFKRYKNNNIGRRSMPENQLPEIPLDIIEPIYEMIDESNMIDNLEILNDNNQSVTDLNDTFFQSDNNGYLTPYEFTGENTHENNSIDSIEYSDSSNPNHLTASLGDSTSSSSEIQERRSSYLYPYQLIVHSVDIHEYASTHSIGDSFSSGSGTPTTESGYINPYQPMISDNESHEYKCVHCHLNGSDFPLSETSVKESEVAFQSPGEERKFIYTADYKSDNEISSDIVSMIG